MSDPYPPVSLFTYVELYDRALDSLAHLLNKGEAFADEHGISTDAMLDWRLVEDMNPLRFQVSVVVNFARNWTARVVGHDVPESFEQTLDLAGFRAAIADAKAHLAALTSEHFADRDAAPVTFRLGEGMEPTMPAGQWLTVFASTNLYFHLSMVYAILRMKGVPLSKPDLFAGRL